MLRRQTAVHVRTVTAIATAALLAGACAPEGPGEVRLIEGTRSSPDRYGEVQLSFQAPVPGTLAPDGGVMARLALTGFQPGVQTPGAERRGVAMSGEGQHVHLIVDNEPYRAIYDVTKLLPVDVAEPGFHLLRAFPARQWHESVKAGGAFATDWFFVPDSSAAAAPPEEPAFDPEAPLLTYSRPKGEYVGSDADSILVDFFLSNVSIGPGPEAHRVRLTVDDTLSWDMTRWVPHFLLGLPDGQHRVKLELIAPDSTVVRGPYNTTRRTITVRRDQD